MILSIYMNFNMFTVGRARRGAEGRCVRDGP